ncbi:MAG TPA: hypothetical protein VIK69_08445 [Methylophilaceae bacterium]
MGDKINIARRSAIIAVVSRNVEQFRPQFLGFIGSDEGMVIYTAFEEQALRVANSGRKHYSARTIAEYIRHQTALRQEGEFKINNVVIPDMARLFALRFPRHSGLFEFRATACHPRPLRVRRNESMHEEATT